MSGRSALVRRKVNNSRDSKGKGVDIPNPHAPYYQHSSPPLPSQKQLTCYNSPPSNSHYTHYAQQFIPLQHQYGYSQYDYPQPPGLDYMSISASSSSPPTSLGTGIGAPSGRFLQFSGTEYSVPYSGAYAPRFPPPCGGMGSESTGNPSSTDNGPSSGYPLFSTYGLATSDFSSEGYPCCSYHYSFGSPPTSQVVKTEDTSGIENSHLRAALDKRSDDVRKGLAKTFTFRKKSSGDRITKLDGSGLSSVAGSEGQAMYGNVGGNSQDESSYSTGHNPPAASNIVHPQSPDPNHATDPLGARLMKSTSTFTAPHVDAHDSGFAGPRLLSPVNRPAPTATGADDLKGSSPPLGTSVAGGSRHDLPLKSESAASDSLPEVTRWIGDGKQVVRWDKQQRDPELWDPNGDVLVYICHTGEGTHPPSPAFRLSSHVIEATRSSYFMEMLVERSSGIRIGSPGDEETSLPGSPHSAHQAPSQSTINRMHTYNEASPFDDQEESLEQAGSGSDILYEMFLPPPSDLTTAETLRHNLTTRNVFAMLYHASIVGTTLYTALTDVLERLESVVAPGSDNLGLVLCHLLSDGMDDIRGNLSTAISLLAFCERPNVRWEEGWLEFFTHAVGMIASSSASTEEIVDEIEDYQWISHTTKTMMDRAILDIQVRIQVAETRMTDFAVRDVFRSQKGNEQSNMIVAKAAGARLRDMLVQYYTKVYGSWPPAATTVDAVAQGSGNGSGIGAMNMAGGINSDEGILWLSRPIANTLARDFGLLWEHLVDREVVWATSKTKEGRERIINLRLDNDPEHKDIYAAKPLASDMEEADKNGFPMTEMLLKFDASNRYSHIPHPFPLIPDLGDSSYTELSRDEHFARKIHLAYGNATNDDAHTLAASYKTSSASSDLIDAYLQFEKNDRPAEVDPSIGRLGRWLVVYGVLQTLAEVSVDAAWLRWKDGVEYHLGIRLGGKGMTVPPWRPVTDTTGSSKTMADVGPLSIIGQIGGEHERSWCWEVAARWARETARAARDAGVGGRHDEAMTDGEDKAVRQQVVDMRAEGKGMQEARRPSSMMSSTSSSSSSHWPAYTQPAPISKGKRSNDTVDIDTAAPGGQPLIMPILALVDSDGTAALEQDLTNRRRISIGSSISSSTDSGFELPVEWDVLPRRESLNGGDSRNRTTMTKRSPNVSLVEKTASLRGDSPTLKC